MARRTGSFQSDYSAGEFAPNTYERFELERFAKACSYACNLRVLPQGGVTNAPGTIIKGRVRKGFLRIADPDTSTAPSGGVAAGAISGTGMTTGAIGGGGGVILDLEWVVAKSIVAIDLIDAIAATAQPNGFVAEYHDGATWQAFGTAVKANTFLASRRFAVTPRNAVTATRVRIRATAATGVVTLKQVKVFAERAAWGKVRIRPFTFDRANAFDIVFTDLGADIYSAAGWIAAVPADLTDTQIEAAAGEAIETLVDAQRQNTAIITHKDRPPAKLTREEATGEWDFRNADFTVIPNVEFDQEYTNHVPAKWRLKFVGGWVETEEFVLTLNGKDTSGILYNHTAATLQTRITAALQSMPDVKPGVTVTDLSGTPRVVDIEFTGKGNEGPWATLTTKVPSGTSGLAIASFKTVEGVVGGEPVMSPTRGYSRCSTFYEQRTVLLGFKSLPTAALLSATGDYFETDTKRSGALAPLLLPLDGIANEAIVRGFPGRNLFLLTEESIKYMSQREIDAEKPPNIVTVGQIGVAGHVPPAEDGNSVLVAGFERGTLWSITYDDRTQNYEPDNISYLASHLLRDIRDMAVQKATSATDASMLFVTLGSGKAVLVTLLQRQGVVAFARRETPGSFLVTSVNGRNVTTAIVERIVDGVPERFLEEFDETMLLDASVIVETEEETTAVSGLGFHEGEEVWCLADDRVEGPFTVAAGAITLAYPARRKIVGRWIAPRIDTLPLSNFVGNGVVLRRKRRIPAVTASVVDTTHLALGRKGGALLEMSLHRFGEADIAGPELLALREGDFRVKGILGWTQAGIMTVSQLRPGHLTLRSLTLEPA